MFHICITYVCLRLPDLLYPRLFVGASYSPAVTEDTSVSLNTAEPWSESESESRSNGKFNNVVSDRAGGFEHDSRYSPGKPDRTGGSQTRLCRLIVLIAGTSIRGLSRVQVERVLVVGEKDS